MRTLGALVLLLALVACGTKAPSDDATDMPTPSGPPPATGEAFEDADWVDWSATYTDVRRPGEPELTELAERAQSLNGTSWTAGFGPGLMEIAYTPERVRIHLTAADVHLDPRRLGDEAAPLTVCGDTCTETSLDERRPGGALPQEVWEAIGVLGLQVAMDELTEQVRDYGRAFVATVDSPVGALDCFLLAPDVNSPEDIEGDPVVLDPTASAVTPVACVDQRGLVIRPPSGNLSVFYASWSPGIDAGGIEPDASQASEATQPAEEGEEDAGQDGVTGEVGWSAWEPTYRDARMATQADVVALTERVEALNASEWTATLRDDVEVASGPDHVRATIMRGAAIHFDPAAPGAFVLCVDDDGCLEEVVTGQPDEGDVLTLMATSFVAAVVAQRNPGLRLTTETAYAVLDSPVGELECLVDLRGADVRNLQGARPDTGWGDPPPGTPNEDRVCVDERGLVLLTRAVRTAPLLDVLDWAPGAPSGFDEHPAPEPR